jgi:hypothetical protein
MPRWLEDDVVRMVRGLLWPLGLVGLVARLLRGDWTWLDE